MQARCHGTSESASSANQLLGVHTGEVLSLLSELCGGRRAARGGEVAIYGDGAAYVAEVRGLFLLYMYNIYVYIYI